MMKLDSSKQLKIGAIISYAGIIINILSGLLYTPWMVKELGTSDYGLYTLATSFIAFFLFDFGIGNSVARFISKYRSENNEEAVGDFLSVVYKLYLIISIIIFAALVVIYFFIENIFVSLTPHEIARFRVVFIIVGIYSVFSFPFNTLNGILISHEKFIQLKLCSTLQKLLTIALMVPALLFNFGLYALIIVNAFVGVIVIIIKLLIIGKTKTKVHWKFFDWAMMKTIVSFSIWVSVIGLSEHFITGIHPTLLSSLSGSAATAVFGIANTIRTYTWSFADALNGMFLPKVARLETQENSKQKIDDLFVKVGRIQFIIIGAIISGFIVVGKNFITVLFDAEYIDAYPVVILMIIPYLGTLTQEVAKSKLYVNDKVKYQTIAMVAAAVVSTLIAIITIPSLGVFGSGIGISIGLIVGFIINNIIYKKYLNINVGKFYKECFLKLLPVIALVVAAALAITYLIPLGGITGLVVDGGIYVVLYIAAMWFIGMNKSERAIFTDIIKRKKK